MAKVLVLYGTREGQTRRIAERIAEVIRARGHTVILEDAKEASSNLNVRSFEAACVGGPIYRKGYPRAVVRFARDHRGWLQAVPSAFFSVGLAMVGLTHDGRAESQRCVDRFARKTGWNPARVAFIAGALPYSKYGPFERWVMRRAAERAGGDTDISRDYEYTDWTLVDQFASNFSDTITSRVISTEHSTAAE